MLKNVTHLLFRLIVIVTLIKFVRENELFSILHIPYPLYQKRTNCRNQLTSSNMPLTHHLRSQSNNKWSIMWIMAIRVLSMLPSTLIRHKSLLKPKWYLKVHPSAQKGYYLRPISWKAISMESDNCSSKDQLCSTSNIFREFLLGILNITWNTLNFIERHMDRR